MTLRNAKLAYLRICPAWIRRGIKSILQSSVQAQVHGAVGGLILTVAPLENFAWSTSKSGDDEISMIIGSNEDSSLIDSSPSSIIDELIMDSSSSNQPTIILEEAAKSIISEEAMDAVGVDSIELFEINEAVESIVEGCADQIL